jgi:hypothetical protein
MNENEVSMWVKEEMGELFWKFREDVDDEGGMRLEEELEYLEGKIIKIINKHKTVE